MGLLRLLRSGYGRRMLARRAVVLTALGCALTVGGCSRGDADAAPTRPVTPTVVTSDPTPTTTSPQPSVTTTPSGSAAPTVSTGTVSVSVTVPAAARAHNAAGAEAFARFFLNLTNESWLAEHNPVQRQLTSPTCRTCGKFSETSSTLADDRLHYDGPPMSLGDAVRMPESTKDNSVVQFVFVQNKRLIVDVAGHVIREVPRRTALSQWEISWTSGAWRVDEIKVVNLS